MSSNIFITHTCKNSRLKSNDPNYCFNGWVDEDKHNSMKPPLWKYCPECEAKGFKNPKTRKCTRTPEQIESFKQRMQKYRANK